MGNMWIEEARVVAEQCWRDIKTEKKEIDFELCEAVAQKIAMWMDTAAQNQRNADYYRGLVVKCGEAIGESAYIADDGVRHEDILCAKVPELVKEHCAVPVMGACELRIEAIPFWETQEYKELKEKIDSIESILSVIVEVVDK